MQANWTVSIEVPLDPETAFDAFMRELRGPLAPAGIDFTPGPDGVVSQSGQEIGRVTEWVPGELARVEWHGAKWNPSGVSHLTIRCEPAADGCRLSLDHTPGEMRELDGLDLVGWFAAQAAAPLLEAASPAGFGDWLTDRRARKPSGPAARDVYADPVYHWPNFGALLDMLALTPEDYLLEVGCGGGALLREALRSGCRAAAVDHSSEMVDLARETNGDAVREGRVEIHQADAARLPFPDGVFTAAVMTGVLGFLPDPVAALSELRRTLAPGGRLAALGSDPALKGTPAAPEPMASRLHFYTDDELAELGHAARFSEVRVERHDLERHARASGVPEEHIALFRGATSFLWAVK